MVILGKSTIVAKGEKTLTKQKSYDSIQLTAFQSNNYVHFLHQNHTDVTNGHTLFLNCILIHKT